MLDVDKYLERKVQNPSTVTLSKVGGSYAAEFKKFDPDTGTEVNPEVVAIGPDELKSEKALLQEKIDNIDAMIGDINALV